MKKFFCRRYIIVPAALFIYGAAMAAVFGPDLIKSGHTLNLIGFAIVDTIVIILAFIFLRKRYRMEHPD